jgi:hypothetical protein
LENEIIQIDDAAEQDDGFEEVQIQQSLMPTFYSIENLWDLIIINYFIYKQILALKYKTLFLDKSKSLMKKKKKNQEQEARQKSSIDIGCYQRMHQKLKPFECFYVILCNHQQQCTTPLGK